MGLGLTTPFTAGADVVTAVAFAAMGTVAVVTAVRRRRAGDPGRRPRVGRAWIAWAGLFVALEVATYIGGLGGGRHAFPTFSSLLDAATAHTGAKVLVALAWLGLGWGLFGP